MNRILIVDDNPILTQTVGDWLKRPATNRSSPIPGRMPSARFTRRPPT